MESLLHIVAQCTMGVQEHRGDIINLWGRGVKYFMRQVTFRTGFESTTIRVIKVTWPGLRYPGLVTKPHEWGSSTSQDQSAPHWGSFSAGHLTVLLRVLGARRPGPQGLGDAMSQSSRPGRVRITTSCIWKIVRGMLPLPPPPPRPRIKLDSFTKTQPRAPHKLLETQGVWRGEIPGSFPYGC